jgi:hypothetical protein
MEPQVCIYLRRTLDWGDAALVERELEASLRPKFEAWNATFNLAYHEFRQRIKRITELNLSRVEHAVVAPLDEIPDHALIVPIDDDDWFSPRLADGLRAAYEPDLAGYLWKDYSVELPRALRSRLNILVWRARGNRPLTCGSNSYAVTREGEHLPLLGKHSLASQFFDANPSRIKRLRGCWAVRNRSPASRTAMGYVAMMAELMSELEIR